jgi:UDP-glucose:(heptosyl)LPS alpha-1,3-glucosyltransferase
LADFQTLKIGFVRRGYSPSGGAESYLKRLACGLVDLGHQAQLLTTNDWPASEWPFGQIVPLRAKSPIGFADEVEKHRAAGKFDILFSIDRIWRCDVYRAGDGVHQAWLQRRRHFQTPWQRFGSRFNGKHRDILRLENCLFGERCADQVIANSKMVKNEIFDFYSYRPDRVEIIRNGIPLERFRYDGAVRDRSRVELGLAADEIVALFVGTGWERKGLHYAIDAIESASNPKLRLLVAGKGDPARYRSSRVWFLGERTDLFPIYAASDIFVLPTIYDPFSNACLEALACGLPVITSRANGFSEIMEDRIDGSIIDSADAVADIVSALDDWSDPTRRAAARPSILKRAGQFDISRNVNETVRVIVQAAANRPA